MKKLYIDMKLNETEWNGLGRKDDEIMMIQLSIFATGRIFQFLILIVYDSSLYLLISTMLLSLPFFRSNTHTHVTITTYPFHSHFKFLTLTLSLSLSHNTHTHTHTHTHTYIHITHTYTHTLPSHPSTHSYMIGEVLGKGAFSTVRLAVSKTTNKKWAGSNTIEVHFHVTVTVIIHVTVYDDKDNDDNDDNDDNGL
jgi:hypothetical protein